MTNKILVIGGSNVDFIGKCDNDISLNDSNIGKVDISFGGVGHNIAQNLKLLGADVTFISAIGIDYLGGALKKELEDLGVKVYSPKVDNKTGMYLAIHEKDGKMALGICDQRITDDLTVDYLASLNEVIESFDYIFLDTNLPKEKIEYLLNKYSNKTIFLDVISTSKAQKITDDIDKIDYLKCNEIEAISLFGDYLKKEFKNTLICTRGKKDIVYTKSGKFMYSEVLEEKEIINETGAGDAFFSGVIYSIINGLGIDRGIELGKKCASLTLKVSGAINPDIKFIQNKN